MANIGSIGSSSQLVEVRRITADDLKHVKVGKVIEETPIKPGQIGSGTTAASSLLAPPDDEQKAAAKTEDKLQEAFARMKVEMRTKHGLLG